MSGGHSLHKKDYALLAMIAAGVAAPFVMPALTAAGGAGGMSALPWLGMDATEGGMLMGSAATEGLPGNALLQAGAMGSAQAGAEGAALSPGQAFWNSINNPSQAFTNLYGTGFGGKVGSLGKGMSMANTASGLLGGGPRPQPQAAGLTSSPGPQQPDAGGASFFNMHRPVNTNAQGMASLLGGMSEEEKRRLGLI